MVSPSHPWLQGPIRFSRSVIDHVDAHAVKEYPSESCGLLLGPINDAAHVDEARATVNLADKYHAVDPETFPRTSRSFYMIDARVIDRTFTEGERNGRPVKVIYHSHCDVGAYFSQEDQNGAAPDGVLSYPALYLVTSVRADGVDDHKLFGFHNNTWVEVPFSIEP